MAQSLEGSTPFNFRGRHSRRYRVPKSYFDEEPNVSSQEIPIPLPFLRARVREVGSSRIGDLSQILIRIPNRSRLKRSIQEPDAIAKEFK